jgi:hypothetical protein
LVPNCLAAEGVLGVAWGTEAWVKCQKMVFGVNRVPEVDSRAGQAMNYFEDLHAVVVGKG